MSAPNKRFRWRSLRWELGGVAAVLLLVGIRLLAQGVSFTAPFPAIVPHATTGLQVDYSAGKIVAGGLIQAITAGNVTVANTQTNCQAPRYPSCNFLYWPGSGGTLLTTTTLSTAYAAGNVVVAFVTATGGNISAVTPATTATPLTPSMTGYWVPPSACQQVVSGNSTGTNGQTVVGASNTPAVQSQTSASGTNTHTYLCNISPTLRPTQIVDATFYYGVQTNNLGTQAATLGSGTLNSSIVFSTITYPLSAPSETPSTVTPARADAGTLVLTPVVGSFNVAVTTAGAFYGETFTPASPIPMTADGIQLLLTITLQMQATTATITNSPGVYVRMTR